MLEKRQSESILDKSLVRHSFGRVASSYDEWAVLQRRIGDRLLETLNVDWSGTPSILDLGAGTGYCTRQLSIREHAVIGLDIAFAMLVKARSLQFLETSYVCGDAESLPIQDQCIDIVFSNLVMQWCCDLDRLFAEVYRVLKPGGLFLFSTFGPQTLVELRNAWQRVDIRSHVNEFCGCSTIRDALSRSGLRNQSIEPELMIVDYHDVMALMRELKGIGAHNMTPGRPRTLTGKEKISRMIAEYEKINMDQRISATFELILGRCDRPNGQVTK